MRCRYLDIFKILGILWIFSFKFFGFFLDVLGNFSGGFLSKNFLGRNFFWAFFLSNFLEVFFGSISLGAFFWEHFFWKEFFVYIGNDLVFVKILSKSRRKEGILQSLLRSAIASSSNLEKLTNFFKSFKKKNCNFFVGCPRIWIPRVRVIRHCGGICSFLFVVWHQKFSICVFYHVILNKD